MGENDKLPKAGLPPRERNADVPAHASSGTVWIGGVIAAGAVLALLMFGSGNSHLASNSSQFAPGTTTGLAPAKSSTAVP